MKSSNGVRQSVVIGFSVLATLVSAGAAKANLVQNGDFSNTTLGSPGGYFGSGPTCASNVADWQTTPSSQGSCGNGATPLSLIFPGTGGVAFNNFNGLQGTATLAGYSGNYVADDGDPTYATDIGQKITGLTAGDVYTLTFYQSAGQQNFEGAPTTEFWDVSFASTLFGFPSFQSSAVMSLPGNTGGPDYAPWELQTMKFTATSVTEYLNFFSVGAPSGVPPVALLADVTLTPEPSYLAFMGVGLLSLFAVVRAQRKRRA